MATDVKKHTSPAPGEFPARAQLAAMILSANDVIPVANATEEAQIIAALNAVGAGPTASRPILFSRADAPGLRRVEYTYDGTSFVPLAAALDFATLSAATTWAGAYGSLLTHGDTCRIGTAQYAWDAATAKWWPAASGVRFKASFSGAPAAVGGASVVNFPTVVEDTVSGWSAGTYTVKVAGVYLVTAQLKQTGGATVYFSVLKNGGQVAFSPLSSTSGSTGSSLTDYVVCAAGDTLQIFNGAAFTPTNDAGDSTFFAVVRLA